jgi:hypothetical protein
MTETQTYEEWLQYGVSEGWCGVPVCITHDGEPLTDEEEAQFSEGEDPCVHMMRMYESSEDKASVEQNHSPSQWRASNGGITL